MSKKKNFIFKLTVSLVFVGLFLLLSQYFFPFKANAVTENISLIRQDCTGYTNCYASLFAWESAKQRDLVALNETETVRIEGNWTNPDTTQVSIDGWTTSPTNYIKIYTASDARHSGVWNNGKYRLEITAPNWDGNAISIHENYVRIDGLQISFTDNTAYGYGKIGILVSGAGGNILISNNIIRNQATAGIRRGIVLENSAKVWNNIIYNQASYGIEARWWSNSVSFLYNNTVYGSGIGIFVGDSHSVIAKNNISYNNTDNYIGVFDSLSTNNLSGPTQADAPGYSPKNSTTVSFVSSSDFHIASSDTSAKDAGADISSEFTTDIDGQIRPGLWDIGADETTGGATATYLCSDGIDNDSDSLTDYPSDTGCSSVVDNDEYNAPVQTDTTPPVTTASPIGGAFTSAQAITLIPNETAVTYYTTDNSTPTTSSSIYTSPIQITANATLKYFSKDTATNTEVIKTQVYTIGLPDTTPPTVPTGVNATPISATQINVSWSASTDTSGIKGYNIYQNNSTTPVGFSSSLTYSNTGLTPNTTYSYTVSSVDNSSNESIISGTANSTTNTADSTYALPAFPGAEGFGANTIGGRGGKVIKVTNLNDHGPGSFREAVEAPPKSYANGTYNWEADAVYAKRLEDTGHRIVVFEVSGIINLESDLSISYAYVTIAGETSPGGILITGHQTTVQTHDIIMRHMRFRVGSHKIVYERDANGEIVYYDRSGTPPASYAKNCVWGNKVAGKFNDPNNDPIPNVLRKPEYNVCELPNPGANIYPYVGEDPGSFDSFDIWGKRWSGVDAYNIMVDHCSFSWGIDETFTISGGVTTTTVQWSIISEGLSNAGHEKGGHSKGLMVDGNKLVDTAVTLHHNYIAHNTDRNPLLANHPENPANGNTFFVNGVNNVSYNWYGGLSPLVAEMDTKTNWIYNYAKKGPNSSSYSFEATISVGSQTPKQFLYVLGNTGSTRIDQSAPEWNVGWSYKNQLADIGWQKTTPWPAPAVTTTEMSDAYASEVLNTVGATKPFRDSVDARVIADFASGTGTIRNNVKFPEDFPVFQNLSVPADTDNDGMSDSWETSQGFNTGVDDSAQDKDSDGYTNIEEYLHSLAGGVVITQQPKVATDTTPNSFTLTPQTGVALNTVTTSNTITISGIDTPTSISIFGGTNITYSINGGAYTSNAGTITNGQTVTVKQTSSTSNNTTTTTTLNIGGGTV
jgi:parallel beta-helix repeat protein